MGCCCKEEVDPDENEFEGPLKHRRCTDIICLLIFIAYIIAMIYMFGFAMATGDPYRIIYGYDVSGDVCGANNVKISGVGMSGKDLSQNSYLYFDIPRTVQIVGGQALADANKTILSSALVNRSNSTNQVPYCLTGIDSATTAALHSAPSAGVMLLQQNLFDSGSYVVTSETSNVASMVVALKNGKLSVYQTDLEDKIQNSHQFEQVNKTKPTKSGVTFYHKRVRRQASQQIAVNNDQQLSQLLLESDPVNMIVTGGGACRYCVNQCPQNYTIFFWRCVPPFAQSTFMSFFSGTGTESVVDNIVKDIESSWKEIIYMCLVALGLSLIMIVLLRFLAGVIVYIIMISIALACIIAPVILWLVWFARKSGYDLQQAAASNSTNTTSALSSDLSVIATNLFGATSVTKQDVDKYLTLAIIVTVVAVILLLILLVLRKRIKLVVQLFFEAGKAIQTMPLLLLQPLWTFLAVVVVILAWTVGLLWIESAGYPEQSSQTGFVTYVKNQLLALMILFHVFGLLWLLQFVIACQHMVIAGGVATWYFTRDKASLHMTVLVSVWRVFRYHLGTVAFGSFIIALVQLIRLIMKYLEKKAKEHVAGQSCGWFFKCINCCLWCFEKCLKFLNRNAYIEVAIYGVNFCSGARKAFATLANNILRVAALNSVGTFVLFLGKLTVVVATVLFGIQIMHARSISDQPITNEWAPILLAAIFAYVTSHCFISVYGMAIDTIFLCFCEDSDKNDGIKKPYYMSTGLMEYVENSSKALEALQQRQATGGDTSSTKIIKVAEADNDSND